MTLLSSSRGVHRAARRRSSPAKHVTVALAAGALLGAGLLASPAGAVDTSGTWGFYPGQTYTDSPTTEAGPTAYKTAVRPPINADKTSNFPAKRGVVPVQFDLLAATSMVTSTTRTYDPPVWQSITTYDNPGWASYATFTPSSSLTFDDITDLRATYTFTEGDCWGGSLRWTINVTPVGSAGTEHVHVYYGTPNGPDQSCTGTNSWSGQNLVSGGITPDRFEVQGHGAPVYTTYAAARTIVGGDAQVNSVSLILDSGWMGVQKANVSDVSVNGNVWVPKTTETLDPVVTPGTFAKTCDLPAAELRWAKDDASATGAVNEGESIQPKDTGQFYRQVDCKYIYNLDVSSLDGAGTYAVWANVDGDNVQMPATFDLR